MQGKPKPRYSEIRDGVPDEAQRMEPVRQFMERTLGQNAKPPPRGNLSGGSLIANYIYGSGDFEMDAVADVPSGKSHRSPMRPIRISRCRKAFLNAGSAGLLAGLPAGFDPGGHMPSKLLR